MAWRSLLLGLLLAGAGADLRAQWEIFAQSIPADGSWATYRITTVGVGDKEDKVAEIKVSSRDGTVVEGVPMVWLEIEPVKWLGSKNKGRLSFLIPRAMDKEKAARLIHVSREILFTDPVRGPWYMFPEDVKDVTELVEMKDQWTYTPAGEETVKDGQGRERRCEKQAMRGDLSLDPPLLRKIATTIEGTVWRDATTPFGVVRAEWTMVERKGSDTETERKRVELLDWGVDTTPPAAIVHGDRFSYWKLIRR